MNKKDAWKKFKETGKIEYYLKYKEGKQHKEYFMLLNANENNKC